MARLQTIVAERTAWEKSLTQVKRMQQWVLDVEHILDGSWAKPGERLSNAKVERRFDRWHKSLAGRLTDGTLTPLEQECLQQFLQVLSNLRPHLIQCYNREAFPRTNNDMERSIRRFKTRYRRISGRKNWNNYLLRSGRCVAYDDWWEQDALRQQQLLQHASRLDRARWRQMRREAKAAQSEQRKRFRFRHKREAYLSSLEVRWAAATTTQPLP